MTKFFMRWVVNAIALYLAIFLLDGRGLTFTGDWLSIVWLALIFGLVNAFLRPLLSLLTCPLIILTLGLFTLLINTFLFWLTGEIGQAFNLPVRRRVPARLPRRPDRERREHCAQPVPAGRKEGSKGLRNRRAMPSCSVLPGVCRRSCMATPGFFAGWLSEAVACPLE
jgi:putative membrane protein